MKKIRFESITLEQMQTVINWTAENRRAYIEYALTKHAGKLEDVISFSTHRNSNAYCMRFRALEGSICQKCYVDDYNYRTSLTKKLMKNQYFFTSIKLNPEDIPVLDTEYIRFESFADLNNTIQVWNYCMIARQNPQADCALWTKNPGLIKTAMKFYGNIKPDNMQMIFSYLYLNGLKPGTDEIIDFEEFRQYMNSAYPFIDKVFIVYDYRFAYEHNITINCGRKCNACRNSCYKKNGVFFIAETEKHAQKKAGKTTVKTIRELSRIKNPLFIIENSETACFRYEMTGKDFIRVFSDEMPADYIAYKTGKNNYHIAIRTDYNGIAKFTLSPAC